MKKLIPLLFIILIGCSPQKRLSRIYKNNPDLLEQVIDSSSVTVVKIDTLYKDTAILVNLPADTIYNKVHIYKTDTTLFTDTVTASNEFAMANAWLYNDSLYISLTNRDSALVNTITQEIKHQINQIEEKYIPTVIKQTPRWINILLIVAGVVIIILSVIIIMALKR